MEWISVKDRLPEYNFRVLVCYGHKQEYKNQTVAMLLSIRRHGGKDSPFDNRWFITPSSGHEIKVTHWMPLPKPPINK